MSKSKERNVRRRPPVLIGERVLWLGSGSGLPKGGQVKWMGRLLEIGPDLAVGLELDEPLPFGGIDGTWGNRQLFKCEPKHGLIVPCSSVIPQPVQKGEGVRSQSRRGSQQEAFGQPLIKDSLEENPSLALVPRENAFFTSRLPLKNRNFETELRHTAPRSLEGTKLKIERLRLKRELINVSQVLGENQDAIISKRMIHSQEFKTSDGSLNRSNSINSSRSGGSRRDRKSGLFSFFHWFKKEKSEDSDLESPPVPGSPVLAREHSISGSVDTLFSTATAHSFAFVPPLHYRPFGNANQPEIRIALGPETNTYKNRIRQREYLQRYEKNISIKEKYSLYASGTLTRSVDRINDILPEVDGRNSSIRRKKRKAPPPPLTQSENCLPSSSDAIESILKQHRRALSEPTKKYHVKGKRKAPQPPTNSSSSSNTLSLRKKRPAPPPPSTSSETRNVPVENSQFDQEETASNASTVEIESADIVSTDTLRLERGILKPNKMEKAVTEPKFNPSSPVSPRPWYKRNSSSHKEPVVWKLDKKKEKEKRDFIEWLESGFPRRTTINGEGKYNIFTKIERPEDKRKSQISILTNISELDREAAEIIKKNKAKEQAAAASQNAAFYVSNEPINGFYLQNSDQLQLKSGPDLLKAVSSTSAEIVHTPLKVSAIKEVYLGENKIQREVLDEAVIRIVDTNGVTIEEPEASTSPKISKVTIEELDEYDAERNSKSLALFEANRLARHQSPFIPTIAEVSESSAKSSSPGSTLNSTNSTNESTPEPMAKTEPTETKVKSEQTEKEKPEPKFIVPLSQLVWSCPRCTLENCRWKITCEACDMWRPSPCEFKEKKLPGTPKEPLLSLKIVEPKYEKNENIKAKEEKTTNFKPDSNLPPTLTDIFQRLESTRKIGKTQQKPVEPLLTNNLNKSQQPQVLTRNNKTEHDKAKPLSNVINDSSKTSQTSKIASSSVSNVNNIDRNDRKSFDLLFPNIVSEISKIHQKADSILLQNNNLARNEQKVSEPLPINSNIVVPDKNIGTKYKKNVSTTNTEKEHNILLSDKKYEGNNESKIQPKSVANDSGTNALRITESARINKAPQEKELSHAKDTQTVNADNVKDLTNLEEHRNMLKEMLKEMKHSLSKDHRRYSKELKDKVETNVTNIPKQKSEDNKLVVKGLQKVENGPVHDNENIAEAYLIESETIVEEIKLKKPSEKVSSSAQTSAMVRQISPKIKPPTGKEIIVPVTVEEYKITNGVLYTSISKEAKRIGTGKFELMRARDFNNIESIKASKGLPPVYANVPEPAPGTSKDSDHTKNDEMEKLTQQLTKPQGLANFRAGLEEIGAGGNNVNTMAVNRLLKRLESAIMGGQLELAAALARELAQLKINCSVTRQKAEPTNNHFTVDLYVEDKQNHQGPFPLRISPQMTVAQLKRQVEREYDLPTDVQRWILGKTLAHDESATLESLGVQTANTPVFLYLVVPENKEIKNEKLPPIKADSPENMTERIDIDVEEEQLPEVEVEEPPIVEEPPDEPQEKAEVINVAEENVIKGWRCARCTLDNEVMIYICALCGAMRRDQIENEEQGVAAGIQKEPEKKEPPRQEQAAGEDNKQHYQKLIELEKDDLIPNLEEFDCPVCFVTYDPMAGVVLRECLHVFCRACLAHTVEYSEEAEVKCPFIDENYSCNSTLLEREIKALVTPKIYEEHLAKSIALAETKIGNAFHCKTPDCKGWCIYEDNVNLFKCPVCTHVNCVTCQAIHEGLNCKQFQEQLNTDSETNADSRRTKEMLQEMVDRGEAMNCPTCQVVLMKKWGCDWLRCSMCKTEICWITRGPRWGPNGKGDTSGGCQCGINGIKCHPKCTYCH